MLGVTDYTFRTLVDVGRIQPRLIRDQKGREVGRALYVRREIEQLAQELAQ